mmetsp:Transcript_58331/g.126091  ORF Transcript_58331/g.126091 Transcript_58331/m.126091 type:complete len:452 (+) Transcript_58331:28-1383(+)
MAQGSGRQHSCVFTAMDFWTYKTTKKVVYRSYKIALFYYFLLFIVVFFFVAYKLAYQNKYLKIDDVRVYSNVQAAHPTRMDGLGQALCDTFRTECHSNFTVFSDLPYCNIPGRPKCHLFDAVSATVLGEEGMLLRTWGQTVHQTEACMDYTQVCDDIYVNRPDSDEYFVADVERFWIWTGHNLFENNHGVEGSAFGTEGYIDWGHGDELIQLCSELKTERAREDAGACKDELGVYLLVGRVLNSLDASLDKMSSKANVTNRERGLLLVLEIKYANTVNLNLFVGDNVVRYRISMFKTEVEKYQVESFRALDEKVPTHERTRIRERGVKVMAVGSGQIGAFNFSELMFVLVQLSTVLALVSLIMDHLLTHPVLISKKEAYENRGYAHDYKWDMDATTEAQRKELARVHHSRLKREEIQRSILTPLGGRDDSSSSGEDSPGDEEERPARRGLC